MRGKLIIISGPSGTGKTTVVHYLLDQFKELTFSISATTRPARHSEVDGQDYYFLAQADFEARIQENAFLEYEEVYEGIYYGTLMDEIEQKWKNQQIPVLDIDVKGALNIDAQFSGGPLTIFIHPGSLANLETRLKSRGTEHQAKINKRLERADEELRLAQQFQHVLYNYQLEATLANVKALVAPYLAKANDKT